MTGTVAFWWCAVGAWAAVILSLALSGGDRTCATTEERTLPLFAKGPKHHIHGPQIGWVRDEICTEWVDKSGKKQFVWPKPVY